MEKGTSLGTRGTIKRKGHTHTHTHTQYSSKKRKENSNMRGYKLTGLPAGCAATQEQDINTHGCR